MGVLTPIVNAVSRIFSKHGSEILIGLGIAGGLGTAALAVKGTVKAVNEVKDENMTKIEVFKATWRYYIPAAISEIVTIGCLACAIRVNIKHRTALMAAYTFSEATLQRYQNAINDKLGERKHEALLDDISKKEIEEHPISKANVYDTKQGATLCFDPWTARYFYSSKESIERAEIEINRIIARDLSASLNDFYDELCLPHCKVGDLLGWYDQIELYFSSHLDENDNPCLVFNYRTPPKYEYDHLL